VAEALAWFVVLLGVPGGALLLGLAIWALSAARAAQAKAEELEGDLRTLRRDLHVRTDWLRDQLARTQAELARKAIAPAEVAPPSPVIEPQAAATSLAEPIAAVEAVAEPQAAAAASAEPVVPSTVEPAPVAAPPPPATPERIEPEAAPPEAATLEERIGLVWFTRIGAVILLLGVAYFFKYAVDNAWVGPAGRVALGVVAGLGILTFAELTRATSKRVFTHVVLGVGLSFLLFSVYASHAFYDLVPSTLALGGVFVVSVLGGALAIRHRGQAILVLSEAAALAAPVLLSTGQDRPLALFAYVLLVTSLASAASVRERFAIAPWVGVVGSLSLYAGWHARFWDVSSSGDYLSLGSRVVPAAFVALASAQWIAVYLTARRRKLEGFGALGYLVVATLFLHVGATSLIHDLPVALGVVLSILGAGSIVALRREGKPLLLALPMMASFASLAATSVHAGTEYPAAMTGALAIWAAVYLIGLLAPTEGQRKASAGVLALTAVIGLFLLALLAEVLAAHHSTSFRIGIVGISALYAVLAVVQGATGLGIGALLVSLVFLGAASANATMADPAVLAASGLWAAVYFGAGAYELLVRKSEATAGRVMMPAAASVGFVVLALSQTRDRDDLLRAALMGAVAAANIGLGAMLLRRGDARRSATTVLGLGLAALATAAAFLLSGAAITVAWIALATVVLVFAAREREPAWVVGAGLLFACATLRLGAFDLQGPARARDAWISSYGSSGHLVPAALFNERTLALVSMATGLFVGAFALRRSEEAWLKQVGAAALSFGHAIALLWIVIEAKRLLVTLPAPPASFVDRSVFDQFLTGFLAKEEAASTARGMVTTLVFGLYASGLVAAGFGRRSAPHRWLGLGLFAITLAKLGLWDVWNLSRVQQIFVLMGVGALLLAASFLYARFGKRLVTLLKEGAGPVAVFLIAWLGVSREAHAISPPPIGPESFVSARTLDVREPGLHSFVLDVETWRAMTHDNRLFDLQMSVPFVMRPPRTPTPPPAVRATVVDPVKLSEGGARAVLDLGSVGLRHSTVKLTLSGATFARKVRIETSADERDFRVLTEGAWVFRLAGKSGPVESTTVGYPPSDARYLRVSVLGGSDGSDVGITGAEVLLPTPAAAPSEAFTDATIVATEPDTSGHGTTYVVALPATSVPVMALDLDIGTPVFERRATVTAGNRESLHLQETVGGGVLFRVGSLASPAVRVREGLRLTTGNVRSRHFRVHVDDGDDKPLDVRGVRAVWQPDEIVFLVETPGPVTVFVGCDRPYFSQWRPPSNDLERVLARAGAPEAIRVVPGPLGANPRYVPPAPVEAPPVPWTERHRVPLAAGLAVVLTALGVWAVVLLRGAREKK
jgi:uncharacterized membrane protein